MKTSSIKTFNNKLDKSILKDSSISKYSAKNNNKSISPLKSNYNITNLNKKDVTTSDNRANKDVLN